MSGISYAGEYDLREMKILTSAGNILDVKNLVQVIEIFEDINSPALTGSLTLLDIDNILENAPIIGQEYLSLVISTPTLEDIRMDFGKNVFAIHKVNQKVTGANNAQIVTLSFCSPELLRSNRTRVSKSYTDTIDKTIENVVRDIRYLNSKKRLFIEPTSGIRKVISPNIRPYTFINNLKEEALSARYSSPHFFFFENTKGIHFKSLQSMYEAGVVGVFNTGDLESLQPGEKRPNPVNEFERVLDYQINSNRDMLLSSRGGMLGSNIIQYNPYQKNYVKKEFKYFDDFNAFPTIDENPIYNDSFIDQEDNTIGDFTDAKIHLHASSSSGGTSDTSYDDPNNLYSYQRSGIVSDNSFPHRQSKMLELNFGVNVTMKITGYTAIAAGQVIEILMPIEGRVHEKEFDEYLTGKYLITKMKHVFSQADNRHEIVLNACKDSLPKQYPINKDSREPSGAQETTLELTYT